MKSPWKYPTIIGGPQATKLNREVIDDAKWQIELIYAHMEVINKEIARQHELLRHWRTELAEWRSKLNKD